MTDVLRVVVSGCARLPDPSKGVHHPVAPVIDTVVNLAKRRGFVYPSGEIYGGTKSAWDYGPLGVELKENIKRQWWRSVVTGRDDVVGIDSSIILPREVWVASGHVDVFHDPLVESLITHKRYRADHLIEAYEAKHGHPPPNGLADIRDPETGEPGQWTQPREFNMMLKTYLGPIETEEGLHYLRPETAQGIFVNFANVVTTARKKPPFGIGQIGKSFRNEITPGNFIFRTREFEQMEMEFFVEPATAKEWHQYWIDNRLQWYIDLGIRRENLRLWEHPKDKLSHYSDRTVDIEYKFGFMGNPWGELEGVANRTDFDLSTHARHSGVDLSFYDQINDVRYTPYVIEPAAGLTRSFMAFLITAHTELEHVTLERELGRFKRQTDQRWAELVYDGLWYSPLKAALEAFVAKTQEHVSGEVRLVLHGGHIAVNGRRSAESLYDFNLATYDEGDSFDQSAARGFVYVHGLSSKLAARRDLR